MQQLGGGRRAAAVETRDDQLVAQKPTSSSAWSRRALYKFNPATAYCRPERRSTYPGAAQRWTPGPRRSRLRVGGVIRDAAHLILPVEVEGRVIEILRRWRTEGHRDGASAVQACEQGRVETAPAVGPELEDLAAHEIAIE